MNIVPEEKPVEYRIVVGFPAYRVGDDGSVWTKQSQRQNQGKSGWQKMSPCVPSNGYAYVTLYDGENVTKKLVSRLILEMFVGPCPSSNHDACHFPDKSPLNNALGNLRWATRKENCADKKLHGTQPVGERVGGAVLTTELVVRLRNEFAAGTMSARKFAQQHGLKYMTVYQFLRGTNWKYAGGPIVTGPMHKGHKR